MKNKKLKMLLLAIVLCISCFLTCFATTIQVAYAFSIGVVGGYTNVLEDLQKDDTFNAEDYPVIQDDYSLQVIQIAESNEKDLFVYVYQPCSPNADLKATSINMSLTDTTTGVTNYNLYQLSLLNTNGVFSKYVVKGFVVSNNSERYYSIASIFSPWYDKYYGNSDIGGSSYTEKAHKVAKCFAVKDIDSGIAVSCYSVDTITITNKWTSYIRFSGGWGSFADCDAFFCAFASDIPLENVIRAKMTYSYYTYYEKKQVMALPGDSSIVASAPIRDSSTGTSIYSLRSVNSTQLLNVGDIIESDRTDYDNVVKELNADNEETVKFYHGLGELWTTTYSWKQIMSKSEYLEEYGNYLNDTAKEQLSNKQWVFNFHSGEHKEWTENVMATPVYKCIKRDYVKSSTILEITYKIGANTYNVGVIDNKQNATENPAGIVSENWWDSIIAWIRMVIMIIFLVLLVVVLYPFLPVVFSVIWTILKGIFKIILWLVTAPIKLIGKVFKKRE